MTMIELVGATAGTIGTAILVLAIAAFGRAVWTAVVGKDHEKTKSW